MTTRIVLLVGVVVALLGVASLPSRTAEAHAALVRSAPAGQARLPTPPVAVDLWFSEPLEPRFSGFTVYAGGGRAVAVRDILVDAQDPRHMTGRLPQLRAGIYTVAYETLSTLDGHEWRGSYSFAVLDANGAAPGEAAFVPDLGGGSAAQLATGRWFTFVGLSLLLGGAATVLAVARRSELESVGRGLFPRLAIAALPLLWAGAALQLLDQHQSVGGSWGALLAETRFGTLWLVRQLFVLALIVLLALIFLTARRGRRRIEDALYVAVVLASAGAMWTIATLGHAAAAPGGLWAIAADFVHLVVAAGWVGGLVLLAATGLALLPERGKNRAGIVRLLPVVGRFSLVASIAMYVLVLTGLVRSFGQLPTAAALLDTSYGRWLLVKLGLLGLALGVAFLNRRVIERAATARSAQKTVLASRLRRLLPLEATLAIALLFSVAVLGQTPPPVRATDAASAAVAFIDVQDAGEIRVHLEVSPAQAGPNELRVHVFRSDGGDIGLIQRAQLTLKSGPGGGDEVDVLPQGDGLFVASNVMLGLVTQWEVQVDLQREGRDDVRLSYTVPIARPADPPGASGFASSPAPQFTRNALIALAVVALGLGRLLFARQSTRQVRIVDRTLGGAIVAAGLFALTLGPITHGTRGATPESVAKGRALYNANCVSCHGPEGRGDGPMGMGMTPPPADLPFHLPQHSDSAIRTVIIDGVPAYGMPGWGGRLDDAQIDSLIDFLRAEFDRGPQSAPGAAAIRETTDSR